MQGGGSHGGSVSILRSWVWLPLQTRGMPETLGYLWQGDECVVLGWGAAGEHGQGSARLQDPFFFTQMIAEVKCVEDHEAVALKEHTAFIY